MKKLTVALIAFCMWLYPFMGVMASAASEGAQEESAPQGGAAAGTAAAEAGAGAADDQTYNHFYITPYAFKSFGSWTLSGDFLLGRTTASNPDEANGSGGEPAIAEVRVTKAGDYRLWVRDRDYATNQQGTRTFHVAVDGVMAEEKFGDHGQEGFRWSEVGIYRLEEGVHELALHDTSGFYARCAGFFLSDDLSLVPPEDENELLKIVQPMNPFESLPSPDFPAWAKADVAPLKTDSIENDSVKVVFYQGQGEQGRVVQNEIYVKSDGEWTLVKKKTEELGFLMMAAKSSEFLGVNGDQLAIFRQTVSVDGAEIGAITDDFFNTGVPVWFIPSDYAKVGDRKIELSFPNAEADLKVTFELDSLADDPKVTLHADFPEAGAYSFMLYSGDAVDYADYDTVTAPLLYVKKAVPDSAGLTPESYLFTPMATLHYPAGSGKAPGKELTSGVIMDPTSVPQGYAYPDTSHFGLVLRSPDGDVRPQFAAPMFGTPDSLFDGGDSYEVSYRIVNRLSSWYDTLADLTERLYNFKDLRTNYFASINEAIYNATDLMMDDDYGGWDPVNMAHYNMEEKEMTTLSNSMAALQRYLLTEDEEILDKRAVPTLAFMLSRQNVHFKITDNKGGASYSSVLPTPIGGPVANYTASVYGGLYEMTQGRMPFLLDTAVQTASQSVGLSGVADQAAMYKYTHNEMYLQNVKKLADQYLANNPATGANREKRFVNAFVFGDYIPMVTTFLAAYEATGERKYLDAAADSGHLLATSVWTTGYQNDYATTDYTVDPAATAARPLYVDQSQAQFWWHGERQWRLGNVDGEAKPPQESGPPLQEETAPGWLFARAGMGTEHPVTPGHGNVISMNTWAGMLVKLSEYTGDPYFQTMARNAMLGRFGNYPGYYQDRMILHQMKPEYPYTGPDYTSIYWHHIPVFISMLEDFLINSAWAKSGERISFPSIYQSGYAYFASNQFGQAPGTFYDEDGMWLWLDRGIIETDTPSIDYIAAKKDGVLGLALLNEGNEDIETVVALGDKVPGGAGYTGTATVYEADGTASELAVANGEFVIRIPSKGIRSVVLQLPGVKKPAYANTGYVYSNNLRGTVSEHTRGKGHVIQVEPDSYYAYVYISDMNDTTSKLTIRYRIGDEQQTQEKTGYPYEFLIKVDDPSQPFVYELEATKTSGQTEQLGGGTLSPNDFQDPGITIGPRIDPEATEKANLNVNYSGTGGGNLRLVVNTGDFPFMVTANGLSGLNITGTFTNKADGSELDLNSRIVGNELRADGTTVLVVQPTGTVPLQDYPNYSMAITVHYPPGFGKYGPVDAAVTQAGLGNGAIRLVIPTSGFPYPVTANLLSNHRVTGTLKSKTDGSALALDSLILGNEARADGTTVLVVKPTATVPLADYSNDDIAVTIQPEVEKDGFATFDLDVLQPGTSAAGLRMVVPTADLPFTAFPAIMAGLRVTGTLTSKIDGSVLDLDSVITTNEVRADGTTVLVIRPTEQVPLVNYKDYGIALTVHAADVTPPTATVQYSSTEPTTDAVTATIVPSEDVTITNNGGSARYTFLYNGSFTFEFVDAAGNAGSATATVGNIRASSAGAPGKAVLSNDNGYDTGLQDGAYNVAMNLWWGNNGRVYKLYENDALIDTRILADVTPNAQSVVTSVYGKPNGRYRYYAELTNAFGTTRTDEMTVTVEDAAPGEPVLSANNWSNGPDYEVEMNLWWGTNGTEYRLYENGELIDVQPLAAHTPDAQSAVTDIRGKPPGTYVYRAELVNEAGTTASQEIVVRVDG